MAKALRGYQPDIRFFSPLLLSAAPLGVAGTLTATATLVFGTAELNADLFIQTMRLRQVLAGAANTTTVEVFRVRAGTPTSLGTISVASGAGNNGSASTVPASAALQDLQAGDFLTVQLTAVQSTVAQGVTVEILFQ